MMFAIQADGTMPKDGIDFVDREGKVIGRIVRLSEPDPPSENACPKCGVELQIGDFPFCPHERGSQTVIGDDVPGGFIAENGFDQPRTFYSKSEHAKALAAEGLEIRAKNAGPDDKHVPRWDTVDLDAAAALVSRGEQARAEKRKRWADASIPITVTDGDTFTAKDLDAD